MIPFHSRFPDLAVRETRSIHVLNADGALPPGEYSFVEYYCGEPGCDCRRVLLSVRTSTAPNTALATINFGWESPEFYTRRMHGDVEAGREITSASLDPINPQSRHADHFLGIFRDIVKHDADYVARLARHYEMFKNAPGQQPSPVPIPEVLERTPPPPKTIPEILRQLRHVPEHCEFAPYEAALSEAIEQREAIVPELIAAIDHVSANPGPYLQRDNTDYLHHFAIYLLAQLRETRALDCFLRFFSLPGEQCLDLTADLVTGQGAAVLASVCGGDPAPLLRLIHDETVNEFVRTQAIEGLLVQGVWGERPREAVIAELRGLFATLPKPGDPYVWAGMISAVDDFNALELLPEARQAYAEDLVDDSIIRLDDIDPTVPRPPRSYTPPTREEEYRWFCERNKPIDAVAECSLWRCFRNEANDAGPREDDEEDSDSPDAGGTPYYAGAAEGGPRSSPLWNLPAPTPYVAPPKVGRNDPCPCGSGKKYKKCCGK